MNTLTPGFIAAHSHRLEDLTDVAVKLMAAYPLSPLQEEAILVQSNGIAQWLKTDLAANTGIAAMLDVTLPARFVWRAYRAVLGDEIPRYSPYDKDRLRWRLMRLLPSLMENHADFASLKAYVAEDEDQRKLFQLSDKLADLMDQYQVYRAEWLDAWSQGADVLLHRGQEQDVPENQLWQPALWRALVDDIGRELICSNRAQLHRLFIERAQQLNDCPEGIPARVIVFGISSLPRQTLEVLHALKGVCQVVLCVHNPCQYHWADIVDGRELFKKSLQARSRIKDPQLALAKDEELHLHAQPLLASWGKQGRDYIHLLDEFDETRATENQFADLRFDLFDEIPPRNLLQQLQSDILHLRPLHETQAMWQGKLAADDRSICFHRCHSPQREIEVLHDQLLAAFADDSELQPRDIMVMVPDINEYGPYINAVFGRLDKNDPRYIPFTVADQGQRHRNPVLLALESILSAPQQRFAFSDIFDLLHVPALQQRFSLRQADVDILQQWAEGAGARWGLHALHRQSLGLSISYEENSWIFALKRMLYGYAAGEIENSSWHEIEPYAEVTGLQARAAGALAALMHKLEYYWVELARMQKASEWYDLLQQLLDDLFFATEETDRLLLNRLHEALDTWQESVEEAKFDGDLRYNIVQDVWLATVDEGNLNQRFMAGSVNFATLMPMRAIPFKQVCLLGMNDSAYPRSVQKTDFDLMVGHYQPGDRSRREDDRYLFLEALLSARQQLYISWVGMSAQDNSELPPSVLVSQLQDHLNAGWSDKKTEISENLTTQHRLQPFAQAYYSGEDNELFTYATEWSAIHSSGHQNIKSTPMPVLLPYQAEVPFALHELEILLKEPAQLLARKRLGVYLSDLTESNLDAEAFAVDGLSHWQLKHELLNLLLQQAPADAEQASLLLDQHCLRVRKRGALPYGHGADEIENVSKESTLLVYEVVQSYISSGYQLCKPIPFTFEEGDFSLADELNHIYQSSANPQQWLQMDVSVSKVVEKRPRSVRFTYRNLCRGWLRHLAASLVVPAGTTLQTVIVGIDGRLTLPPLAHDEAAKHLAIYGQWLQEALIKPLPVALSLAEIYWQLKQKKQDLNQEVLARALNGDTFTPGLASRLPYLTRHFKDAKELLDSGMVEYSERFYESLFLAFDGAEIAVNSGSNTQENES